jgi:hypothetical protein
LLIASFETDLDHDFLSTVGDADGTFGVCLEAQSPHMLLSGRMGSVKPVLGCTASRHLKGR